MTPERPGGTRRKGPHTFTSPSTSVRIQRGSHRKGTTVYRRLGSGRRQPRSAGRRWQYAPSSRSKLYRDSGISVPHHGHAIEALLRAGANATATNVAGRTPWDLAQANEALRVRTAIGVSTMRASMRRGRSRGVAPRLCPGGSSRPSGRDAKDRGARSAVIRIPLA